MKLYILYGSTKADDDAEHAAKAFAKEAEANKTNQDEEIICDAVDKFRRFQGDWSQLPSEDGDNKKKSGVIVIYSGGDAPDNATKFLRFIKRTTCPKTSFQNVRYGVLCLGEDPSSLSESQVMDTKLGEKGGVRVQQVAKASSESESKAFLESLLLNIRNGTVAEEGAVVAAVATAPSNNNNNEEEKKEDSSPHVEKMSAVETKKTSVVPKTNKATSPPLYILYGSATGNAEFIAKDLAGEYEGTYFKKDKIVCAPLNSFKKEGALKAWELESNGTTKSGLIIVCSTTGNGDVPDNGERFARWIGRKSTPENIMGNVAYGVLALGDTNYDQFCQAGIVLDSKIGQRGGARVLPLAMADEATGLEDVVEPFKQSIFTLLEHACRGDLNKQEETKVEEEKKQCEEEVVTTPPVTATTKDNSISNSTEVLDTAVERTTPVTVSKTIATTPPSNSSSNSSGVAALCRVLLRRKGATNTKKKLDKPPPPLRSCKVIHSTNDIDNTSGVTSSVEAGISNHQEWECHTVSSVSLSGIMYTYLDPHLASITKARYLTNTSTTAAKEAMKKLTSLEKNNNKNTLASRGKLADEMMCVYDQHFPLKESQDVDAATAERNAKRVLELTLSLPDDFTFSYEPGDSIGFMAPNPYSQVRTFWNMLQHYQKLTDISLETTLVSMDKQQPVTLEYLLTNVLDLTSPFTNKNIVRRILKQLISLLKNNEENKNNVSSEDEKQQIIALEMMLDDMDLLEEVLIQPRWTIVDLMQSFPILAASISFQQWIETVLPRLPPRYYSISSSPLVNTKSQELTIAFSIVDYNVIDNNDTEQQQRRKGGIATRYLEAIASPWLSVSSSDASNTSLDKHSSLFVLPIFPKPTTEFRLPSSLSTPLVLIGPGTGIAPFLGFLQHRHAQLVANQKAKHNLEEGTWRGSFEIENQASTSSNNNSSVIDSPVVDVYFGCRNEDHDYLFRSELESYQKEGHIRNLHTAFSRSSKNFVKKEYVQDKMTCNNDGEDNDLVQLILEGNASVYVCGDGNHMAKDVQGKIMQLLSSKLNKTESEAKEYFDKMKQEQRFVMDIWS